MEYIAAFSLATQSTATPLGKDALKSKIMELLSAINAPVCEESLDLFLSKVDGKSLNELIASGSELMKSQLVSSAAAPASTPAASAPAAKAQPVEESESSDAQLDFF